jgi:hypothetical protein
MITHDHIYFGKIGWIGLQETKVHIQWLGGYLEFFVFVDGTAFQRFGV